MAGPFRTQKVGEVFRVVRDGEPQPEIDNGGFRQRQEALDAATQANVQTNTLGSGKADEAADAMQNRRNRLDRALNKATGR